MSHARLREAMAALEEADKEAERRRLMWADAPLDEIEARAYAYAANAEAEARQRYKEALVDAQAEYFSSERPGQLA